MEMCVHGSKHNLQIVHFDCVCVIDVRPKGKGTFSISPWIPALWGAALVPPSVWMISAPRFSNLSARLTWVSKTVSLDSDWNPSQRALDQLESHILRHISGTWYLHRSWHRVSQVSNLLRKAIFYLFLVWLSDLTYLLIKGQSMWNGNREGDSWQQLPCSLCELQNLFLNVEKLHTFQKHLDGCAVTVKN